MLGLSPRRKFRPNLAAIPGRRRPAIRRRVAVAFQVIAFEKYTNQSLTPESGMQITDIAFLSCYFSPETNDTPNLSDQVGTAAAHATFRPPLLRRLPSHLATAAPQRSRSSPLAAARAQRIR